MTERDRYLKTVKRQLKKAGDHDGEYYSVICQEVDTYCTEHSGATLSDVQACFGTPASHAAEFSKSLPDEVARQKLILRKRLYTFMKVVLAVLAAALIILLSIHVADTWSYTHGYGEYSDAQSGFAETSPDAIATY